MYRRIAIIGAGFCGLATAWYLFHSHLSPAEIILFDERDIGGGASGIAAGLLHPYAGAHAKLNRMGKEGLKTTYQLLQIAAKTLGRPVFSEQGILRPALTEEQKVDFIHCANKYPEDVNWMETKQTQEFFPYLSPLPGLWIKQGIVVYSSEYLQGLWQACALKGAVFERRHITALNELDDFDVIILATGASTLQFQETQQLPLSSVKGQILALQWPTNVPPLPFVINSHAYILMSQNRETCLVGATFERGYSRLEPDLDTAVKEIMPKALAVLPCLQAAPIIGCYAGMRATTPTHLPLIKQIGKRCWVFTGMGSKGLLYHALAAQKLVQQIEQSFISE